MTLKIPFQLYVQEINPMTYAMAKMNMIIHDMEGKIKEGDTLKNPRFLEGGTIKKLDNPMWNQRGYDADFYESDPYDRFLLESRLTTQQTGARY